MTSTGASNTHSNKSSFVDSRDLLRWCLIPAQELPGHPELRVPYRQVGGFPRDGRADGHGANSDDRGKQSAGPANARHYPLRADCWYEPFRALVNAGSVSLKTLHVFHIDSAWIWEGQPLPAHASLQLQDLHGAPFLRRHSPRSRGARRAAPLAAAVDHGSGAGCDR